MLDLAELDTPPLHAYIALSGTTHNTAYERRSIYDLGNVDPSASDFTDQVDEEIVSLEFLTDCGLEVNMKYERTVKKAFFNLASDIADFATKSCPECILLYIVIEQQSDHDQRGPIQNFNDHDDIFSLFRMCYRSPAS